MDKDREFNTMFTVAEATPLCSDTQKSQREGNHRLLDTLVTVAPKLLKPEGPEQRQRGNCRGHVHCPGAQTSAEGELLAKHRELNYVRMQCHQGRGGSPAPRRRHASKHTPLGAGPGEGPESFRRRAQPGRRCGGRREPGRLGEGQEVRDRCVRLCAFMGVHAHAHVCIHTCLRVYVCRVCMLEHAWMCGPNLSARQTLPHLPAASASISAPNLRGRILIPKSAPCPLGGLLCPPWPGQALSSVSLRSPNSPLVNKIK